MDDICWKCDLYCRDYRCADYLLRWKNERIRYVKKNA